MKNKSLLFLFALAFATAVQGASVDAGTVVLPALSASQEQAQAARIAAEVVRRLHYQAAPLDDALSSKIFDQFIKALDSEKLIFTKADIDQMAASRAQLDNAILESNLTAPFAIFNLYERRLIERFSYARILLKQEMDFGKKETFPMTRKNEGWPQSDSDARELWRKRVKSDWLRLRLAGKDDKSTLETLDKRYENSLKRVGKMSSEDAFQIFMNAYTMAIDPHTNYLGPKAAANFDISMRLSLIGIGAVLQEKEEYTLIRELVPGGPAALSGQLEVGDSIVGVAQGGAGAMVDIMGWRSDDAVSLIRGPANSVVRLDILPSGAGAGGKHKIVTLVRQPITLNEQAAKKTILSVVDRNVTRRIGVISLPSFYEDFEARQKGLQTYKSASRDVAQLLKELKQENVSSVLIDLRNNGGGSLKEAIDLTGLFIDKGPVVQQRDAKGGIRLESDTKAGVAWDGPMGVLINRNSASASEIFAAAIQDYGLGLIIGEPSFGKGTVQNLVDLDQLVKSDKPRFGGLRLTVAQFFRINGGTTQLRGVTPDILFPSAADDDVSGESSFDNPLPWRQIKAADFSRAGNARTLLPQLLSKHATRIKKDKDFQFLLEDIQTLKSQRKNNFVSLNEAERLKERDAQEAKIASRQALSESGNGDRVSGKGNPTINPGLRDDGLEPGERILANELALEKARKNAKDVFLNEAVNILSDEVNLLNTRTKVAAPNSQRPRPSVN